MAMFRKLACLCVVVGAAALVACSGSSEEGADEGAVDPGTDVLDETPADADAEVAPDVTPETDVEPGEDLVNPEPGETGPDVTPPCTKDEDCTPTGALKQCEKMACNKGSGDCEVAWDEECYLDNRDDPWLDEGFEGGLPQGWTVNVPPVSKSVTWSVVDSRHASGTKSLYFGDPKCHTYYSGALDAQCDPIDPPPVGQEPSWVKGTVTTSAYDIPVSKGTPMATFYVWIEAQAPIAVDPQPDVFKVIAVISPGTDDEQIQEVFSSMSLQPHPKNTDGAFVFVTANLKDFEGKTIALRFSFDSLGADDNDYEGVYVDDVKLFSYGHPTACTPGDDCAADNVDCTSDKCVTYSNKTTKGYCGYPLEPGCVEPQCNESNWTDPAHCAPPTDPCMEVTGCSPEHTCIIEPKSQCCTTSAGLDIDFDDGSLGGFSVWSYKNDPNVKWQVTSNRAVSGAYSLYYGNVISKNYDNGSFNMGEATSPAVEITAQKYPHAFLSLNLFVSTEYDDGDPTLYSNPMGTDFFEILVVQNLGKPAETSTRVWSSHNIKGTTGVQFIPVGVDLSQFAGKTIWIRFAFNTGDDQFNNYEGVYIDDVKLDLYNCEPVTDCKGVWDCGYDDYCRKGTCESEVCTPDPDWEVPADCCVSPQDCDKGDPCYLYNCISNKCYEDFVEGPLCCQEDTFADWFLPSPSSFAQFAVVDASVPQGGPDVTWRYAEDKAHSTPGAFYFGSADGTTYDNGGTAHSSLTSPEVEVPTFGQIGLSFFLFIDMETALDYNDFWVEVVPMDAQDQPVKVAQKSLIPVDVYGQWFEVTGIDMQQFKGKNVKVRFVVDTRHHDGAPGGKGLWVDDVRIKKVCL